MARDSWTDERLHDLSGGVDSLDRHMDQGFREVREELLALRGEMSFQLAAQRRIVRQLFGGTLAATAVGFLGTIAAIVTQT